jgi:hypothetical protein
MKPQARLKGMSEQKGAGKKKRMGGENKEKKEIKGKKRKRREETETRVSGCSLSLPAFCSSLGGRGRHDKVKVKLASYLIRKAPVLHFSLSL